MKDEQSLKSDNKKASRLKYLIVAAVLLLISVFAFIFHTQNKPDPASVAVIRKAAARQLNKDPNEITEADFASITEFCIAETRMEREFSGQTYDVIVYDKTELSDLKLLKKFVNLEELDLSYLTYTQKEIPKWMTFMAKTGIIDLSERTSLDLSPLRKLTKLKKLKLYRTSFSSIRPILDLTELESLDLKSTQVSDIKPLASLKNLKSLDLWSTQVSDIEPLADLKDLESLSFGVTQISVLEPLRELINLRELDVYNTQISNLEPLSKLTNLRRLVVVATGITDLEPLRELINLEELYISNTAVSNLEPLKGLKNLKLLRIQICNNLSDKQIQELQKALPDLNIDSSFYE